MDKIAQHWIEILLKKSRQLKSESPEKSTEAIADEVRKWFKDQPGDKMNPLLNIASQFLEPSFTYKFAHLKSTFRAWSYSRYACGDPSYNPPWNYEVRVAFSESVMVQCRLCAICNTTAVQWSWWTICTTTSSIIHDSVPQQSHWKEFQDTHANNGISRP